MLLTAVVVGWLAGQTVAQFSLPATVELDIITPQPNAVYQNPTGPWPITFAIQHKNIAETYGFSFGWTIRSNDTRLPLRYNEGASIGVSPALKPENSTTEVWQSLTNVFQTYASQANYQREFFIDWYFQFKCNGTKQGDQVVTGEAANRNASGTIKFYTRPDVDTLPRINVSGSTGHCADLLQTIPISQNLTTQYGRVCPDIGPLGSANSTANPCAFDYQGQTTVGTQTDLVSRPTSSASISSASTPNAASVTTTASPTSQSQAVATSASTTSSRAAAETVTVRGSTGIVALALGLGGLLM